MDSLGLVRDNGLLEVFIPALDSALVFRVLYRRNEGFERLPYGTLPITSGSTMYSLDGGSTSTVPADGVLPARSYTPEAIEIPPLESIKSSVFDSNDMFYLPASYRETLFHVKYFIEPEFIRVKPNIPLTTNTFKFQRDKVILDINTDWGWGRGYAEMIHIPEIRVGFKFANDLNFPVYTRLNIIYGEYVIEIPNDPELIWEVIVGRKEAYRWVMPYYGSEGTIRDNLIKVYGIPGFPVINDRSKAVSTYSRLLTAVKVGGGA